MVAIATASLIASIIALLGSVASAAIAAWATFYSSEGRKHLDEVERVMSKYRDPLLLSACDLERMLLDIASGNGKWQLSQEEDRTYLFERTCFLLGQYFCWVYILRRETQFLRLSTDNLTRLHTKMLDDISKKFAEKPRSKYAVFMIRPGHQEALGEEMTNELRGGERTCIGYHTFQKKWLGTGWEGFSPSNKMIFEKLKEDMEGVLTKSKPPLKAWHLQHLLIDFVDELDPKYVYHDREDPRYSRKPIKYCTCTYCEEKGEHPCIVSCIFK
jgi:hypothetical protein